MGLNPVLGILDEDKDDVENAAADGRSTKITGCHEAAVTRTRQVKYISSNNVSFQLQRERSYL